jgi:predicted 3-demethylubiquinone-9 3-methyltransferase (glyoxalase superfamily)
MTSGRRAGLDRNGADDRKDDAMQPLSSCLWFDTQGEEAAEFYTSVFPNSKLGRITHYGSAGPRAAGMVMTVEFELNGQPFVALNGGPEFTFSEAISFQVTCEDQDEVDHYWNVLSEGGEEGPCGWVKDRFGLSWQVVPTRLNELVTDADPERAQRAIAAMLEMRKLDIAELERAADAAGERLSRAHSSARARGRT